MGINTTKSRRGERKWNAGETRLAILNQVTFEQHRKWGRLCKCLGEEQFKQETASAETLDINCLHSYSAAWFYRPFFCIFRYFKNSTSWAALYSLGKTFPSCCFLFTVIFWGKENDSYFQVANQEIETQRKGLMALRSLDSKMIFFSFFLFDHITLLWAFGPWEMHLVWLETGLIYLSSFLLGSKSVLDRW